LHSAPNQSDASSAGQLDDSVGPHQVDELFDLLLLARDFDHDVVLADIDDSPTKHLDEQRNLGTFLRGSDDFDEHQVALDVILAGDVIDADNGDDLVELLPYLVEDVVVAVHNEGHARQLRFLGLADREAVDVEPARGEHARDVGEHAGLILHQGRKHMTHAKLHRLADGLLIRPTIHHRKKLALRREYRYLNT